MTQRIKICHIAGTSEGGNWMFEQLRGLRDRHGFDVAAIVPEDHGALNEKLRSANIPYHVVNVAVPLGPLSGARELIRSIMALVRLFRTERFDVVHTHNLMLIASRFATWIADVPVRTAMIATPYHLHARASRSVERLTHWMETALIPSCEESLQLCRGLKISDERLAPVIYYSPDEAKFDPEALPRANIREEFGWPSDTPVICLIAYFYPVVGRNAWVPEQVQGRGIKGHEDLVRAVPLVLRQFPDAKFLLVGSGWGPGGELYMAAIRELAKTLAVDDSVVFTGFRADVPQILLDANVAVQPSLIETLGGSIEALSLARPTVATRVGGMVDSVRDGETGVLVNPGDPIDLARGITELLREPERAQALGQAGRRLMLERFTLSRTLDELAQLYQRLLNKQGQRQKFYSPFRSLLRILVAVPLLSFIFVRYVFVDLYIPFFLSGDLENLQRSYSGMSPFRRIRDRLRLPERMRRFYYFVRYSPYHFLDLLHRLQRAYRKRT